MNKILKVTLVVVSIALPLQIHATPITILNAGFEAPVTGLTFTPPDNWSLLGMGGAGVWNINTSPLGFWTVAAPEGNQIGYVSDAPSPGSPAGLSQILSDSLAANTIYTLSGSVGHPSAAPSGGVDYSIGTIYTASLYAGGFFLGSATGTGPAGSFTTFSMNFDSTGSAFVGLALEVRLESNKAQTGFDAISLDAQAQGVPDGGLTVLLLGMSMTALGWMRRKMS